MKNNFKEQWFIRKAIYQFASFVFLILAGFGVVTLEAGEQLLEQILTLGSPIIGVLVSQLAANKTHRHSDDQIDAATVEKKLESIEEKLSPAPINSEEDEVDLPVYNTL